LRLVPPETFSGSIHGANRARTRGFQAILRNLPKAKD
jgi:hypothetical protein